MQALRGLNQFRALRGVFCWFGLICLIAFSQSVSAGPAQSSSFFAAQFGHGTDLDGNRFSSEINLINLSSTASQVLITTFDNSGDVVRLLEQDLPITAPQAVSELTVQIPGAGTAIVRSLNDNPNTQLTIGWARLTTQQAVGVQLVFRIRNAQGNLVAAANVPIAPLSVGASIFGLRNESLGTAIALLNPPGNEPATVTIEAIGSDGAGVTSNAVDLQPGEKTAMFLFQYLPELGEEFNGSIEIRSRLTADPENLEDLPRVAILPLLQEGVVLTTQEIFPPRQRP